MTKKMLIQVDQAETPEEHYLEIKLERKWKYTK